MEGEKVIEIAEENVFNMEHEIEDDSDKSNSEDEEAGNTGMSAVFRKEPGFIKIDNASHFVAEVDQITNTEKNTLTGMFDIKVTATKQEILPHKENTVNLPNNGGPQNIVINVMEQENGTAIHKAIMAKNVENKKSYILTKDLKFCSRRVSMIGESPFIANDGKNLNPHQEINADNCDTCRKFARKAT